MKAKHILSIHILITTILVLLLINSCGVQSKKTCKKFSEDRYNYHISLGDRTRICYGTYQGKSHRWCEYYKYDKWIVDDPAVGYKGERTDDYELASWVENGEVGTDQQ